MVDTSTYSVALSTAKQRVNRGVVSAGGSTAKSLLRWPGVPIAAGLVVVMDVWDYLFRKNQITSEFTKEIAASLNKSPQSVISKDLDTVALENPTLAEALKRGKRIRNIDIVVDAALAVGAFALITALPASLGVLGLGAISFAGFWGGKYLLDKVGGAIFGLNEPSIKKVLKHPELQQKLSVPSQVIYLQRLQNTRKEISPEQILTLFDKAKSPISPEDAAMLAAKINDGKINATELAFTVYGQQSGVPERESRELTQMEKLNENLRERLLVAEDKLKTAGSAAKEKASDVSTKWRDKYANRKSPITPDAVRESQQTPPSGISV